jgi:D-alanine-D-alanine ligase-like ATP-grasp enzyme
MEQNSFLFQQPAYLGLAHSDTLACVVQSALRKNGRDWTPRKSSEESSTKTKLPILFGGVTAERQVSLMSGTNAWMKLRGSSTFSPTPYFLSGQKTLTQIPYAFCLAHTVEEISTAIESYEQIKLRLQPFEQELGPVFSKMGLLSEDASFHAPAKHDLYEFVSVQSFVFSGLHGGIGENGTLQAALEAKDIRFNGPGSDASRICMDKLLSSQKLEKLEQEGIYTISKHSAELPPQISNAQGTAAELWAKATEVIGSSVLIVKPQDEGCSAGIVKLQSAGELEKYLYYLEEGAHYIPIGEVGNHSPIEMPPMRMQKLLFEEFIETDRVWTEGKNLRWEKRTGWVEVTVGILERNGELISLTPSMSVASGDVLSVEEKFQGGTGINLTPPPHPQVSLDAVEKVKRANVIIAKTLGLTSYSRTDLFMHTETGKVKFIEVNTTPALTPSTVLYHQALAEDPPLAPRQFLELLITEAKRAPSASA